METDGAGSDGMSGIFAKAGIGQPAVDGLLDWKNRNLDQIPEDLSCYDLDLSGNPLRTLPGSLRVMNKLILDNCWNLADLPAGMKAGSISLRGCSALETLPEGIDAAFLDLSGCVSFCRWPASGSLRGGHLVLRNCPQLTTLPPWLKSISQLDLAACTSLRALPSDLTVSSWIDIGGSGVTSLPPHLEGVQLRWRGVRIDSRIAFHPETITAAEALEQKNAELRRVLIERMGYEKFAKQANAQVLDADRDPGGRRQLLRIDLKGDEPLVCLSCHCPSTGRHYFLRVPPNTKRCHDGAAWIAGFDNPDDYHPDRET